MLPTVDDDTAISCAVLAQEHTDDAHDIFTVATPLGWSPWAVPFSGTAATSDPLRAPLRREEHPSNPLNTRPAVSTRGRTSAMPICRNIVLTADQ
jgi:hypothetical protein